jgi:hypothetical protein
MLDKPQDAPASALTIQMEAEAPEAGIVTPAPAPAVTSRLRASFFKSDATAAIDVPMIKIFSAGPRLERVSDVNLTFREPAVPSDIEAFAFDANNRATRVKIVQAGVPPPSPPPSPAPPSPETPLTPDSTDKGPRRGGRGQRRRT